LGAKAPADQAIVHRVKETDPVAYVLGGFLKQLLAESDPVEIDRLVRYACMVGDGATDLIVQGPGRPKRNGGESLLDAGLKQSAQDAPRIEAPAEGKDVRPLPGMRKRLAQDTHAQLDQFRLVRVGDSFILPAAVVKRPGPRSKVLWYVRHVAVV
jgi:hypothetical protein